jgi:hypothetical protein
MICSMTPGQILIVCHFARWPNCRLHSEKLSLASENPGPTRSAHQLFAASRTGSLGPCQRDGFRRPSQHSPDHSPRSTSVEAPTPWYTRRLPAFNRAADRDRLRCRHAVATPLSPRRAIAALIGRFLPRLGPLVATQAAFLFVYAQEAPSVHRRSIIGDPIGSAGSGQHAQATGRPLYGSLKGSLMASDGGHNYNPMTSVSEFIRSVECIRRRFAGRYWIVSATRKSSTRKKVTGDFSS